MSYDIIHIHGMPYVVWQCRTCGVFSTCPQAVYEEQRAEGGFHHCSNGHQWGWTKENSEREKLRRERDRLKQETARLEDARREAVESANRETARADAAERKAKRLTKRAAAGTCPCCQRTFSNMASHMKQRHPEFVAETGANVVPIKVRRST
jgi:hypothetical protein